MFGAISEYPVNGSVLCSLSFVIGGSFTERVGDPVGWLIGNGRELVAVPVTDLEFEIQVFDDRSLWDVVRPRRQRCVLVGR